MAHYSAKILEEELKNKVREDWFGGYDGTSIHGKIDFSIAMKATALALGEPESLYWAEAKAGTSHDIYDSITQLVLTIGKARAPEKFLPPKYLGAFDAEKIAFLEYWRVADVFTQTDFNWNVAPSDHSTREFHHVHDLIAGTLDQGLRVFDYDVDAKELARFIRDNFRQGDAATHRIAVTRNNVLHIYQKWRLWASTLDDSDVAVMRQRIHNGANLFENHVFQFDFLNDPLDSPKIPQGLRDILADPERRKKLVVYINPPYAEAATTRTIAGTGENKAGVATTVSLNSKYKPVIGAAANELFALFLLRVSQEMPGCILAQFSKPKHVLAPNFKAFREVFQSKLKIAFLVPADTFDNVTGKFPIGFFIWDTGQHEVFEKAEARCYSAKGVFVQTKRLEAVPRSRVINTWLHGFFDQVGETIGWLCFVPNDFQHNKGVFITSKPSDSLVRESRVAAITKNNFLVIAVYLAVRHCIEADWLNDRDQFLWPEDSWKSDRVFQLDCVAFTLFHGQNRISCKTGANHWIPFTEDEVGCTSAFASHFMSDWLRGKATSRPTDVATCPDDRTPSQHVAKSTSHPAQPLLLPNVESQPIAADIPTPSYDMPLYSLSPAARAVCDAGRALWRYYHAQPNTLPDASLYDIRAHFQGLKPNGHMNSDSADAEYTCLIAALRSALKTLAAQITPKVYAHGFLRN